MIKDKRIEISQETTDNILNQLKETTYSQGDRFIHKGQKHILAFVGGVSFVGLKDGHWYNEPEKVTNRHKITQKEFDSIRDGGTFTRYWDSQRRIKT